MKFPQLKINKGKQGFRGVALADTFKSASLKGVIHSKRKLAPSVAECTSQNIIEH
jgi:hypothetical protein